MYTKTSHDFAIGWKISRQFLSHLFFSHLMIKDDSLDDGRWFVDDTDCNSECNDDDDDHKDDDYEKRVLSRKQFLAVFFFAMYHCSVSRSSWSFKRRALTEVTRHARWVMKSWFSCKLVPRFFESVGLKPGKEKLNLLVVFLSFPSSDPGLI